MSSIKSFFTKQPSKPIATSSTTEFAASSGQSGGTTNCESSSATTEEAKCRQTKIARTTGSVTTRNPPLFSLFAPKVPSSSAPPVDVLETGPPDLSGNEQDKGLDQEVVVVSYNSNEEIKNAEKEDVEESIEPRKSKSSRELAAIAVSTTVDSQRRSSRVRTQVSIFDCGYEGNNDKRNSCSARTSSTICLDGDEDMDSNDESDHEADTKPKKRLANKNNAKNTFFLSKSQKEELESKEKAQVAAQEARERELRIQQEMLRIRKENNLMLSGAGTVDDKCSDSGEATGKRARGRSLTSGINSSGDGGKQRKKQATNDAVGLPQRQQCNPFFLPSAPKKVNAPSTATTATAATALYPTTSSSNRSSVDDVQQTLSTGEGGDMSHIETLFPRIAHIGHGLDAAISDALASRERIQCSLMPLLDGGSMPLYLPVVRRRYTQLPSYSAAARHEDHDDRAAGADNRDSMIDLTNDAVVDTGCGDGGDTGSGLDVLAQPPSIAPPNTCSDSVTNLTTAATSCRHHDHRIFADWNASEFSVTFWGEGGDGGVFAHSRGRPVDCHMQRHPLAQSSLNLRAAWAQWVGTRSRHADQQQQQHQQQQQQHQQQQLLVVMPSPSPPPPAATAAATCTVVGSTNSIEPSQPQPQPQPQQRELMRWLEAWADKGRGAKHYRLQQRQQQQHQQQQRQHAARRKRSKPTASASSRSTASIHTTGTKLASRRRSNRRRDDSSSSEDEEGEEEEEEEGLSDTSEEQDRKPRGEDENEEEEDDEEEEFVVTNTVRRQGRSRGRRSDGMHEEEEEEEEAAGQFQKQQSVELETVMILQGPCGSGKTSSVYECAAQLGYKVIEVNTSQPRNSAVLKKMISEAAQSAHIMDTTTSINSNIITVGTAAVSACSANVGEEKNLILFDEVDIVFEEEQTQLPSIIQQLSRVSKCPLILTTERPLAYAYSTASSSASSIQQLLQEARVVSFDRLPCSSYCGADANGRKGSSDARRGARVNINAGAASSLIREKSHANGLPLHLPNLQPLEAGVDALAMLSRGDVRACLQSIAASAPLLSTSQPTMPLVEAPKPRHSQQHMVDLTDASPSTAASNPNPNPNPAVEASSRAFSDGHCNGNPSGGVGVGVPSRKNKFGDFLGERLCLDFAMFDKMNDNFYHLSNTAEFPTISTSTAGVHGSPLVAPIVREVFPRTGLVSGGFCVTITGAHFLQRVQLPSSTSVSASASASHLAPETTSSINIRVADVAPVRVMLGSDIECPCVVQSDSCMTAYIPAFPVEAVCTGNDDDDDDDDDVAAAAAAAAVAEEGVRGEEESEPSTRTGGPAVRSGAACISPGIYTLSVLIDSFGSSSNSSSSNGANTCNGTSSTTSRGAGFSLRSDVCGAAGGWMSFVHPDCARAPAGKNSDSPWLRGTQTAVAAVRTVNAPLITIATAAVSNNIGREEISAPPAANRPCPSAPLTDRRRGDRRAPPDLTVPKKQKKKKLLQKSKLRRGSGGTCSDADDDDDDDEEDRMIFDETGDGTPTIVAATGTHGHRSGTVVLDEEEEEEEEEEEQEKSDKNKDNGEEEAGEKASQRVVNHENPTTSTSTGCPASECVLEAEGQLLENPRAQHVVDSATISANIRRITGHFHRAMQAALQALFANSLSVPFQEPVSDEVAPGYSVTIERPMDLEVVAQCFEDGMYTTLTTMSAAEDDHEVRVRVPDVAAFVDDVRLIWRNCIEYNGASSPFTQSAYLLSYLFETSLSEALLVNDTSPPPPSSRGSYFSVKSVSEDAECTGSGIRVTFCDAENADSPQEEQEKEKEEEGNALCIVVPIAPCDVFESCRKLKKSMTADQMQDILDEHQLAFPISSNPMAVECEVEGAAIEEEEEEEEEANREADEGTLTNAFSGISHAKQPSDTELQEALLRAEENRLLTLSLTGRLARSDDTTASSPEGTGGGQVLDAPGLEYQHIVGDNNSNNKSSTSGEVSVPAVVVGWRVPSDDVARTMAAENAALLEQMSSSLDRFCDADMLTSYSVNALNYKCHDADSVPTTASDAPPLSSLFLFTGSRGQQTTDFPSCAQYIASALRISEYGVALRDSLPTPCSFPPPPPPPPPPSSSSSSSPSCSTSENSCSPQSSIGCRFLQFLFERDTFVHRTVGALTRYCSTRKNNFELMNSSSGSNNCVAAPSLLIAGLRKADSYCAAPRAFALDIVPLLSAMCSTEGANDREVLDMLRICREHQKNSSVAATNKNNSNAGDEEEGDAVDCWGDGGEIILSSAAAAAAAIAPAAQRVGVLPRLRSVRMSRGIALSAALNFLNCDSDGRDRRRSSRRRASIGGADGHSPSGEAKYETYARMKKVLNIDAINSSCIFDEDETELLEMLAHTAARLNYT